MKRNKLIKYAFLLAFPIAGSLLVSSCTDGFENMNTSGIEVDPNDLPFAAQFQEPMTYCYPPHQNMFQFWTNLSIDFYGGYFMTPNGNFTNGDYGENRGHSGGMFENYYLHIFNNTRRIISKCEEDGYLGIAGMMRIVQAYGTLMTTDTYGPLAYKSVLEGNNVSFYYDKQEDIYKAVLADLDKGIEGLKSLSAGSIEEGIIKVADNWCGGNAATWLKIANTLKLRMAMRMVKVADMAGINVKQIAEAAVQDGVLTDADQDILINKNLENELWLMFAWGDCGFNANLVTMMTGFNDPRLPLYMTKNTGEIKVGEKVVVAKDSEYLGIRIGSGLPGKPNPWGNFSGWLPASSYTMPLPIMKVAEAYFLRAEGALRGWNMGGSAQSLYEEGVKVSFSNELKYRGLYAGVTSYPDGAVDAYLNGTTGQSDFNDPVDAKNSIKALNTIGVKWDEGATKEEKLQRIITQKWLALFPLSNEAWAEYRRTGYPKLFPVRVNESNGAVSSEEQIRRSIYSSIAYDTNEAELLKGIQLLDQENSSTQFKGDIGGTRVWWDRADKGNF